jgi:hypothetical protein
MLGRPLIVEISTSASLSYFLFYPSPETPYPSTAFQATDVSVA